MNKRDKYEEEKIKKRNKKEKKDEIEKEKEKKREAYLKEKEEEIRNRKINIDYKKKEEEEEEEEYEEVEEEEEEESSNKREEKNLKIEKEKYDKHIEKNYFGIKGITKRTIGIGRVNVKVYENDEDESWFDNEVKKEKKEKRENKKIEIIQNKNTEDKNMKKNEIKNINYKNNNNNKENNNNNKENNNNNKENNNNNEGKDSNVFNIDGKKFLVKISYNYSKSSGEGEAINIKFSTTCHGSKIVHWGLYKTNSPKIWVLPPKSSYPNFTKEVNNKALETKFPNSQVNGQREISFALPRKLDGEYIGGIYFAIYDPIKNLWYNNFKKNFNLKFN